ncbi:hypothetical protein, partial [Bradyrhizobium sp. CIR3A]|uniref:hypothetical protein n=1 Tax=Bradyrhizobium sp. CIR3A TaxID=2663838 RepID=UPI001AEDB1D1
SALPWRSRSRVFKVVKRHIQDIARCFRRTNDARACRSLEHNCCGKELSRPEGSLLLAKPLLKFGNRRNIWFSTIMLRARTSLGHPALRRFD